MKKFMYGALASVLAFALILAPVSAQEAGDAGMGDPVGPGADTIGDAEDDDGFDSGWIGLAGLLGLAGLMGRDRDRRHDHVTATGTAH